MNWMFLDAPPDGSVMLVWQPLNKLGTRFASDGYVWADQEQFMRHPHQGYVCLTSAKERIPLADRDFRWLRCTSIRADIGRPMR